MRNVCVLDVWVFMMIKPPEWGRGGGGVNFIFVCLFMGVPTDVVFLLHFSGGYSRKFYTGKLRPKVQTLTLLYRLPFLRDIDKWYPFHIASDELSIPFNCCKFTVNKI